MRLRLDVRVLKIAAVVLAVVLIILAGMLLLQALDRDYGQVTIAENGGAADTAGKEASEQELVFYDGSWYAQRDDLETVLVLGLDKYAGETTVSYVNDQQADFLLLLVLDEAAGTCTPIQLNRDTMTEIQQLGVNGKVAGTFTGQLALAHTYGSGKADSCQNTVTAVSNLLYGVDIDHYISVTMDGVAALNDLVGGVTVEVLDDFSAVDSTLVQGETVTLRGAQALTYVRARGGMEDSSNLRRMERQRQYMAALQTQFAVRVTEDPGFLLEALLQLSGYMVSDCSVERLSDLMETLNASAVGEIRTLEGEAVEGVEFMEFYPDEEALQALVMDVFYEFVREG